MSQVIYKYPLNASDGLATVKLPSGAIVLSTGMDGLQQLCLWALVDKNEKTTKLRDFLVLVTGEPTSDSILSGKFIGTVKIHEYPCLIVHVIQVEA